jgi:hypothetical protein
MSKSQHMKRNFQSQNSITASVICIMKLRLRYFNIFEFFNYTKRLVFRYNVRHFGFILILLVYCLFDDTMDTRANCPIFTNPLSKPSLIISRDKEVLIKRLGWKIQKNGGRNGEDNTQFDLVFERVPCAPWTI